MENEIKKSLLIFGWLLAVPVFALSQVSFWTPSAHAQTVDTSEIQDSISNLQNKLEKEQKAKEKLEQNLGQIQKSVSTTQYQINKAQAAIKDAQENISRKEAEIENLNDKIKLQKEMLKGFLQQVYYIKSQPILNITLSNKNFADMFSNADYLLTLEDKISNVSKEISETKNQIEQDKVELTEAREKHEELLDEKVDQKQELVADQIDVQNDIEDKNAIISKLQKQLVELQGDLNALSGKSYSAKDIRDAVEFASNKTGVPEGVLYGFLKMETNLGANTGKCTYKQVVDVALPRYKTLLKKSSKWQASIDTLFRRQKLFYALMDDLGYSKDKKVSCSPAPSSYIGQGGAMGIPQFMSDVWLGYSARITSSTGHKNPDPWELTDGVMAMAIKLKGAGATSSSTSVIKKASINYLGTFNNNYYSGIVYWSKNYKLLFD